MSLRWVRTRGSRPAPDRRAPAASIRGHAGEFAISAARPAVTRAALLGSVWLGSLAMLAPNLAHAQDATWTGSASGNWNDNFNWAPAVPAGTATFDNTALTTSLTFSSFTEIGTLQFATTAPAYFYDLSGRALVIGGAGILISSSSAPTFNAFGLLEFDNAATAGNAIINNTPGATTFTGTSTAGTATITNSFGGLLSFTDSSTAGGASITTNSGSQTRFSANSTAGNATIIANSGALTQFFDNSTAANATISNNGVLNFFDASTAGNAAIANLAASNIVNFFNSSTAGNASITNNGFLGFSDTSTAGNASITNTFFVGFSNASSAGTATITNNLAGTLAFGDSSTAANATITMNNGGRVVFTQDSTGGQARFITNGGGVFDMSGLTGAGMTAGSIEGAGSYALGSKQLTVGGNNLSTQVSGIIADGGTFGGTGGSLVKVGAGTLTLSGVNTYTGATTVNAGTLSVNGSIANSSVTVNAGGMLGGNGTIGNTTINGGTLSPGNSIGTLTVQGNLVLTSASAYIVEVSPTAADRTNVTGTASLAGTVQAVFGPGAYITRTYTILSAAGGSTGTFGSLTTTGLPAGFTASLSYTATDAILNLTATLGQQQIGTGGLSTNQRNVATSLNTFFNNGGTLPPGFVSVFAQTGGNLGNALSQLSGEAATGGQQVAFQMTNQFLGLMLDPFVDGRTGAAGLSGPAIGFAPEREAVPDESPSPMPRCSRRRRFRRRASSSAGARGAAPMAAATARPAIRRWWQPRPHRPHRRLCRRPRLSSLRPTPWWVSRSPAAAPVGALPTVSAAARATPSRPASTVQPGGARPMSRRRCPTPITGCRPTASLSRASISLPASTRRASARGWRAAIASPPCSAGSRRTPRCRRRTSAPRATARPTSTAAASGWPITAAPAATPAASSARASTACWRSIPTPC